MRRDPNEAPTDWSTVIYVGFLAIVLSAFVFLLFPNTSQGAEPVSLPAKCTTLACLMDEARKELEHKCRKDLARESMRRGFNKVWPYDDVNWQHNACRQYALAKLPRR